jgi:Protein of unknown function (DUF2961)
LHTLRAMNRLALITLIALWAVAIAALSAQVVDVNTLKTFGTIGKERQFLPGGAETELFRYSGAGCITHMWFGGNFKNYGLTRIRVYVDNEQKASIDMELMMGHGIGFQDESAPWGVERIGKTGQPSGIYDTYRIPFGSSVRITAQRTKDDPNAESTNPPFWWIIRGVENLPVEIGGVRLPDRARLKLYKVEDHVTKPLEELDMYNQPKSGALYMVTIAGKSTNFCFLESCIRAYLGGSKIPLMLSSGLEDYFLGTYYFNRGKYYTPVAGLTHLVPEKEFSAYRFHDREPMFFHDGLRLTVRAGEKIDGKLYGPPPGPADTVFTTYVWVYEW